MVRHFLSAADLTRTEAEVLLDRAQVLKAEWRNGGHARNAEGVLPLRGKTLALVFEKPSLRTRVAFEAGMTQLGGHGAQPESLGAGNRGAGFSPCNGRNPGTLCNGSGHQRAL